MRPPSSLTAVFIAAVLSLLTASLLVLSFRMHGTLVDLNNKTDRAVKIGDKINARLADELGSIVDFQATGESRYSEIYREQRSDLERDVHALGAAIASLEAVIPAHFADLQSDIDAWHQSIESSGLTTRIVPSGKFRSFASDRLFLLRQAQVASDAFNEAVLEYQSTERGRLQRLAYLFMALAVIFGPLALLALMLIMQVLRRLRATSSLLETRASEEEGLRQVAHTLAAGLTINEVLQRITEATALLARADSVCVETVDPQRNEAKCVATRGADVPAIEATGPYEGSLAQDVLRTRQPRILQHRDLEGRPDSIFGDLVRRSSHRSAVMIPLVVEDRPWGVIWLTRDGFTDADVPKLRVLADIASIALHRALSVERLQKLEDEEHFLAMAFGALVSSLDYRTTLRTIADLPVPRMADLCILDLVERRHVYHAELASADPAMQPIVRQLKDKYRARPDLTISVENVLSTGRPLLVPEVSDDLLKQHSVDAAHFDVLRRLDVKSIMVVPLTVHHQTLGALELVAVGGRRYNSDDLKPAMKFANKAALAIRNAQLHGVANDAIRSRDEVLRVVAHDLRNPLSTIQLSAKLLGETTLPDEQQGKLKAIVGASQRMDRLIDDLLAMGRLDAGQRLLLDLHREDPAELVHQACDMMESQAHAKSVALRITQPSTPLPPIIVDRSRILQVFTNLLDNALKFTSPAGTITIGGKRYDGEIRFAVQDTGSGIDPAEVDKIFDPFWQAERTAHLGAGLGLAIAKAVIEQHGGRIWAESKPGVGTTMTFTIPVARADDASSPKAA